MKRGIIHDGRFIPTAELAEIAGVYPATIRLRMNKHPEWGYEELTRKDDRPRYYLTHEGRTLPLREWAAMYNVSYQTAVDRFRKGLSFNKIFSNVPIKSMPLSVSEENIRWLEKTRYARAGQEDEWQIACDLIGVPRGFAEDLRRLLDDRKG